MINNLELILNCREAEHPLPTSDQRHIASDTMPETTRDKPASRRFARKPKRAA